MDEVIEDDLEGGIAFVVGAIVNDEQRIASSWSVACGEIDGDVAFFAVG